MDAQSFQLLLGTIADQQYMVYVLVKLLVEKGVLSSGEVEARIDQKEQVVFRHDMLEHLGAIGLRISSDQPSTSPTEPSSAAPQAMTGEPDPGSEKKS